jgi:hypothetical protein
VRDESGAIVGLLNVTVETTAAHRAELKRDAVNFRL